MRSSHRRHPHAAAQDPPPEPKANQTHVSVKIKLKRIGKTRNPQYRIVVADAIPDRRGDRDEGLAAVVLPWTRDPQGPTAGVKASSTAATRIGLRYATERRAATGIWLTPDGNVSEALAANVFCMIGDAVVTPPLSDGALAGVTRSKILRYAADDGIRCEERSFGAAQLAAAAEAFVSATSEPVVPLVRLDGSPIGHATPGPMTRRLQALFDRRARGG